MKREGKELIPEKLYVRKVTIGRGKTHLSFEDEHGRHMTDMTFQFVAENVDAITEVVFLKRKVHLVSENKR